MYYIFIDVNLLKWKFLRHQFETTADKHNGPCHPGDSYWNYYTGIISIHLNYCNLFHDDVIKWKHFPRCWPFVRGIQRFPVNSPHKDQWRGALMFSLICTWINDWVKNREAGDLRCYHVHYDVIVMWRSGASSASTCRESSNKWQWLD